MPRLRTLLAAKRSYKKESPGWDLGGDSPTVKLVWQSKAIDPQSGGLDNHREEAPSERISVFSCLSSMNCLPLTSARDPSYRYIVVNVVGLDLVS